ncbi:very-long-chain (3R)-3-hydroxyacyl-CoA dehydratase 4 isoform X3 [Falco biarmicus]|uniref:very-long-chain (3R)-3-hydroxyacyl-CoA dehydratase 4 isoform X3 n=2 Tax=Falco TaxID=8952 RepID=UPI000FFB1471|nr:very-long-chain (3R)-3-hydroxyacyl-CoA dehydratase 4 isoform X3 [Falco rusticolus]XP_040434869.1 very-long-chain (3R)-3-hydroxyacyl-CoA dehydratase 4 isoform X2 [Falco naumanni]XP_055554444.1 very-long-chain (3R)-3-hydroxyacyl-CoA dehydratase 4 isoform X3 [Falco cherrug]XP_055646308.1 very-long-chain (3R)-3-hydroxyacyl-CoA dehydratase 4 isoform X3 [Falco peregrinus]XP_056179843.1 very-long-chain (3R)-3-hydroxyacyl-CoA dehydratase 4 isoform X3 [Falco biarmicus]
MKTHFDIRAVPSHSGEHHQMRQLYCSQHWGWDQFSSFTMNTYLFVYDLMQFCGHSWIFTNMIIRFMTFGKGLVMRLCQLLSILEILHILTGIDKSRLFPRFLQITERIIVLFVVINSQEEVQGKYIVCVLFFLWNILDVVRYTYDMLARMGIYYLPLTWLNFSLCIPLYPLSVLAKAFAICVSLPYFESFGTYSIKLPFPFTFSIYFPYVLKMYLLVLFVGMCFIIQNLFSERKVHLGTGNIKKKRN